MGDQEELVQVVDTLAVTRKMNRALKWMVAGLSTFAIILVLCVFGATIVATRLTKDTEVDPVSGIAFTKFGRDDHSHTTTMKTEDVIIYSELTNPLDMTNDELNNMKVLLLSDGNVKFQIKGYARSEDDSELVLLVEGGKIYYGEKGLLTATGDAKEMLDLAYGSSIDHTDDRHRYLPAGCNGNGNNSVGSGQNTQGRGSF